MKTKTKIKKIPLSIFLDILYEIEEAGIEFVDIEVTHISKDQDQIKIIGVENTFLAQENTPSKFDENRINDIIA